MSKKGGGGAMGALNAGRRLTAGQRETLVRRTAASFGAQGEFGRARLADAAGVLGNSNRRVLAQNIRTERNRIREEEGRIPRRQAAAFRRQARQQQEVTRIQRAAARRLGLG